MGYDVSKATAEVAATGRASVHVFHAAGGKFGYLLVALIALLLSAPLLVEGLIWNLGLKLFACTVLVASLYAARPGRRSLALGLILASIDLGVGRVAASTEQGPPKPVDPRGNMARDRTSMASFRTQLALDRTTLAWIRTTLTTASFGFGMVAFFRSR